MDAGGLYLIEVDRILRPGGYWILSGPPIRWKKYHKGWERSEEDLKQEQDNIEEIANRLSWKKLIEKDDLAIWQKPMNHKNITQGTTSTTKIAICKNSNANQSDAAWYVKMEDCITPLPDEEEKEESSTMMKRWPERASAIPPRIATGSIKGVSEKMFNDDAKLWKNRVENYKRIIPNIDDGKYRNVMDMNAGFAGFATAMVEFPVWVMNVVPTTAVDDTLGLIFERGFIGTYHDWCEAFSTYPRTYDLIHVAGAFNIYQHRYTNLYIKAHIRFKL